MEPAYPAGSVLWVSKSVLRFREPRVRDVIVLKDPRDARLILKRVVFAEDGKYFVRGDNADESTDSRCFGPVAKEVIIGKVLFRYPHSKREWLVWIAMGLAILGLIDVAYLALDRFLPGSALCSAVPGSCERVTTSEYSVFFGIPLVFYGAVFYATVIVLLLALRRGVQPALGYLSAWVTVGFAASLILTCIQAFVIGAYCLLCLFSAMAATGIFVCTMVLVRYIAYPENG
jgi:uncharacterized membrane protein